MRDFKQIVHLAAWFKYFQQLFRKIGLLIQNIAHNIISYRNYNKKPRNMHYSFIYLPFPLLLYMPANIFLRTFYRAITPIGGTQI